MPNKKRLSKKEKNQKLFLEAMQKTFGNITRSCKIVQIDRSLPYKWAEESPMFAEAFRSTDFGEMFKDMVEMKLAKLAFEENPTVLIFLAKTKLKDRGYVEMQRIDHTTKGEKIGQELDLSKLTEKELEVLDKLTSKMQVVPKDEKAA